MYRPPANSATHNPDKEIRLFEVNAGGHTKMLFHMVFSLYVSSLLESNWYPQF